MKPNMPSAIAEFATSINHAELQVEREKQKRRDERRALREQRDAQRRQNLDKLNRQIANKAIRQFNEGVVKLYALLSDLSLTVSSGDIDIQEAIRLSAPVRPLLQEFLDDTTPPELPPVKSEPDDGEDPDDAPSLG